MPTYRFPVKDPDAVLDYEFNWNPTPDGDNEPWLQTGETISSYVLTAEGITIDADSESGGKVTVWLSGGTAGTAATIACRITTSAGRTDERTASIRIRNR